MIRLLKEFILFSQALGKYISKYSLQMPYVISDFIARIIRNWRYKREELFSIQFSRSMSVKRYYSDRSPCIVPAAPKYDAHS